MSRKQEGLLALGAAVAIAVLAEKTAARKAAELGIPAAGVIALMWLAGKAIS